MYQGWLAPKIKYTLIKHLAVLFKMEADCGHHSYGCAKTKRTNPRNHKIQFDRKVA